MVKPLLFGIGFAAGLIIIPAVLCELINRFTPDLPDIIEDDGFITVYPELSR